MALKDVQELRTHESDALEQRLEIGLSFGGLQRAIEVIEHREEIGQEVSRRESEALLQLAGQAPPQLFLLAARFGDVRPQQAILLLELVLQFFNKCRHA
jgi:hypothetical protein